MAIPENKFHATVTDKDRYNFKIHIPEEFRISKELKNPTILTFNTGSTNPSEKLFNIEYPKVASLFNQEDFSKEIIIPKRIAKEIGMIRGDVLEIKKLEEKDKTIFFCSDTTKNEPDFIVRKNLKNKMKNKRTLRS